MSHCGNPHYGSIENFHFQVTTKSSSVLRTFGPQTYSLLKIVQNVATLLFLVTVLLIGLTLVATSGPSHPMEDLQNLIVVARHGERLPLVPLQAFGNFTPGDLTLVGKEQMSILGRNLFTTYRHLIDQISENQAVAMNESRFTESAVALMDSLNTPYKLRTISKLILDPSATYYGAFLEEEKIFRQAVPSCTKEAALTIMSNLGVKLPEEQSLLYGILIADSLDMARKEGVKLPYDLDKLKCVRENRDFLSPELYQAIAKLTTRTFGKFALDELFSSMEVMRKSRAKSFEGFCLSDAHMTGILGLTNPEKPQQPRPGYGANLIFEFYSDEVQILYSPTHDEASSVWVDRMKIEKFLARIGV